MEVSGPTGFRPEDIERLFDVSESLLVMADTRGMILQLSESWSRLLGIPIEDVIGHHFLEFLHPDDMEATVARFAARTAGQDPPGPTVNRYRAENGTYRWLQWNVQSDPDNERIWAVARDVTTEHVHAQQQELVADLGRQALEGVSTDALLQATVDALVNGLSLPTAAVLELLPDGMARVRASTGQPGIEVSRVHPPTLLRKLDPTRAHWLADVQAQPDFNPVLREIGIHGVLFAAVGRADRPWGAVTAGDLRVREFDDAEVGFIDQLAHVLGAAIEGRAAEQRLQYQATHDSLTGLPNRELLRHRIQQALSGQLHHAVGLLLCDLNGFKDVNDSLGHAAGDAVLQQVAHRLEATVGDKGTVARLGGDEFAICVVGPDTELEVLGVADMVVRAMRPPFALPELEVPLSTSIGIVVSPTHGLDASTLLRHADVAMYRAKSEHLGWAVYDDTIDGATTDRLVLTADLRGAIATNSLRVHYQPVIDLDSGTLHSVEALCRWEHPDRGAMSPSAFITLAEQTGLVLPLTTWMVRHVLAQAREWRDRGQPVSCAVNLSMAAVADDIASEPLISELIAGAALLRVEITESWLVDARGREVIEKLAEGGVQLALDDFGTGFSSLASLRAFPVGQLKLDRQFVRDLEEDDRGHDMLLAVAQLGEALGIEVVAEGVEQARTAELLRAAGLHLGQGFLWSHPVPADCLDAWLPARSTAGLTQ